MAWETKKDCVRFGLESVEPDAAQFAGLHFKRDGDALSVRLKMRSGDGASSWEEFSFPPGNAGELDIIGSGCHRGERRKGLNRDV